LNRYFDTSAFSAPPPFTFGNSPRLFSTLRGPGVANTDLSLFKSVSMSERLKLQFRAEFFNAFNRPEFDVPNTQLGSAGFGVISSQANQPRDIQFALKLLF
jgi:hypothetical protein